jgi:hypothetical protein
LTGFSTLSTRPPLDIGRRLQKVRMTTSLTSWLDGLSSIQLALVCCLFFIAITLIGIVLIHPLMRRLIHGERQANDVVIFVAANYGLVFSRSRRFRPQKISRITSPTRSRTYPRCITAPTAIRSLCAADSNQSCAITRTTSSRRIGQRIDWGASRKGASIVAGDS